MSTRNSRTEEEETDSLENELIPYYGGAKGKYLKVTKNGKGEIVNQVVIDIEPSSSSPHKRRSAAEVFLANLNNIQKSAEQLIQLQDEAKRSGGLMPYDQMVYESNLALLNDAVSKLNTFNPEGVIELPGGVDPLAIDRIETQGADITNSSDESIGEEDGGGAQDGSDDGGEENPVQAKKDTALAEAKPVGLAVAGIGGIASSQPKATAIVGPGGLAVANPVATAIAGVDPRGQPHARRLSFKLF